MACVQYIGYNLKQIATSQPTNASLQSITSLVEGYYAMFFPMFDDPKIINY